MTPNPFSTNDPQHNIDINFFKGESLVEPGENLSPDDVHTRGIVPGLGRIVFYVRMATTHGYHGHGGTDKTLFSSPTVQKKKTYYCVTKKFSRGDVLLRRRNGFLFPPVINILCAYVETGKGGEGGEEVVFGILLYFFTFYSSRSIFLRGVFFFVVFRFRGTVCADR